MGFIKSLLNGKSGRRQRNRMQRRAVLEMLDKRELMSAVNLRRWSDADLFYWASLIFQGPDSFVRAR
jgi:hypothetical protein